MDCAAVQPLLSPFLDGELDGSDRDAVTVHLDRCADCVQRLSELRNLGEVWSSSAPPEPSEQAWQRVARGLVNLEDGSLRRFRTRRWLAAAIILLVCCGTAWAIVHYRGAGLMDPFDRAQSDQPGDLPGRRTRTVERQIGAALGSLLAGSFSHTPMPDLPNGYKLQKCCVFCTGVVRYKYARGNQEVILLLYPCGSTVVYGDKPLQDFWLGEKPLKVRNASGASPAPGRSTTPQSA